MKWSVTTAPTTTALTPAQVQNHLYLPDDSDYDTLAEFVADAVDIAEEEMECSLTPRTITATYYAGEQMTMPVHTSSPYGSNVAGPALKLPRGPVNAITSVTSNGVTISASAYELRRIGNTDYCFVQSGSLTAPIVVVYSAGYAALPPKLRRALLQHVGTLYENRESQSTDALKEVGDGMRRVYDLLRRGSLVG